MSLAAVDQAAIAWIRAATMVAAIAISVGVRVVLERSVAAGFVAGAVFGLLLLGIGIRSGWRLERVTVIRVAAGVAGATVLVAIPLTLDPGTAGFLGMRAHPMVLWIAVTVLVSCSEEIVLRGALFETLRTPCGPLMAVALTSLAFALIHVPLYGWAVVPLDLAVGVWLGGLRLTSGGIIAPALAHMIADLATW